MHKDKKNHFVSNGLTWQQASLFYFQIMGDYVESSFKTKHYKQKLNLISKDNIFFIKE